jgi:hypothetical protein
VTRKRKEVENVDCSVWPQRGCAFINCKQCPVWKVFKIIDTLNITYKLQLILYRIKSKLNYVHVFYNSLSIWEALSYCVKCFWQSHHETGNKFNTKTIAGHKYTCSKIRMWLVYCNWSVRQCLTFKTLHLYLPFLL